MQITVLSKEGYYEDCLRQSLKQVAQWKCWIHYSYLWSLPRSPNKTVNKLSRVDDVLVLSSTCNVHILKMFHDRNSIQHAVSVDNSTYSTHTTHRQKHICTYTQHGYVLKYSLRNKLFNHTDLWVFISQPRTEHRKSMWIPCLIHPPLLHLPSFLYPQSSCQEW